MSRFACTLGLILVAGCPSQQPPAVTPQQQAQGGVGCPKASEVYLAQYTRPEESAQPGAPSYTGWTLPLFTKAVESLDGVAQFATLDPQAGAAAGVPVAPPSVWVMPSNGQMCKATTGSYYAVKIDGPVKNISYGVVIAGCAAPQTPEDDVAIALVSVEPPNQCTPLPPALAAARLGDAGQPGPNGAPPPASQWQRPKQEAPLPPDFAAIVPEHACTAPGCEKLWSLGKIELGGKIVAYAGAVNWLDTTTSTDPCNWKVDTFAGFFVPGPDGKPVKVTQGQDHPLGLAVALVDQTGAKVLIADGTGEYATYDVTPGGVTLGRHVTYFLDAPNMYDANDHLGPTCSH